jgi:TIGR03009 family protein
MSTLQSMVIEFNCTRTNAVANITKEYTGSLRCMRLPDGSFGASVELRRKDNANSVEEKYICTGTHIYNISPLTKTVDVYTLAPRQAGQPLDDGPMPFLTGMKADVARKRYSMTASDPDKQNLKPWYTYVHVRPNFPKDQQDFTAARLVIMKRDSQNPLVPAGMPCELFWIEPNKNTTKWDIRAIQRNVPNSVDRREFMKPDVPKDWKVQNVSATPPAAPPATGTSQPRVIRNQDQ